jgi:hypothetical protein
MGAAQVGVDGVVHTPDAALAQNGLAPDLAEFHLVITVRRDDGRWSSIQIAYAQRFCSSATYI